MSSRPRTARDWRLATTSGAVQIRDAATGALLQRMEGHSFFVPKVSWAPDGRRLASVSADSSVRVWDAASGQALHTRSFDAGRGTWGVAWSPDGRWLATGDWRGRVRLWDADRVEQVAELDAQCTCAVRVVAWAPHLPCLAAGADNDVLIWDPQANAVTARWTAHDGDVFGLAWSRDGRWLASAGGDGWVKVWDPRTGVLRKQFRAEAREALRVVWAPSGAFLASSHLNDVFCLWDTRDLLPATSPLAATPPTPVPPDLRPLPTALAALHRQHIHPPASLLRDLLHLLGGQPAGPPLDTLAALPQGQALVQLHWPAPARLGLAALLLADVPLPDWTPPPELDASSLRDDLAAALAAEPIPPDPPPPPLAPLTAALRRVDDRILTLLTILGPTAVAADPGLPLRLRTAAGRLPPLSRVQRQRLVARLDFAAGGAARGPGPGGDIGGVDIHGRLPHLLPWQWALPDTLLHYRAAQHQLLYRAREGREPPQLRPLVILLDVSPACAGPLEAVTRPAAHLLATALLNAGHRGVLVLAGGREQVRLLDQPADLVPLWTAHSWQPADPTAALARAAGLLGLVRDGPLEPAIVLLAHPWFGADEVVPPVPRLRALFVQYPGLRTTPALAPHCERWDSVPADATADLPAVLGRLVG